MNCCVPHTLLLCAAIAALPPRAAGQPSGSDEPTRMAAPSAPAEGQQPSSGPTGDVLYRLTLLRAAPGRYTELLAEVRGRLRPAGRTRPGLAFRHSQGDQWDFALLLPLLAPPESSSPAPGSSRDVESEALAAPFTEAFVAWQEDELVRGPSFELVPGFLDGGLYHFEMFDAAAGRLAELVREREMENAYLAGVGRPRNLIFTRQFGAAWDVFTIGAYRDWRHYAERDLVTPEKSRTAARAAGFESDEAVGPYMRSLILFHHDTLATPIR
jgi:hypothetical protein